MAKYSEQEEKLNIFTHKTGAILGILGVILLIIKSCDYAPKQCISFIVFGFSILTLYCASTLYHSEKNPKKRRILKILDHCAIYILIAGTYTPFALASIGHEIGWLIFALSWSFAVIGIILKLFFTGKYEVISTIMYICMGWMIVFFIEPLQNVLPFYGLFWLFSGGIAYTIGAIIFLLEKIKMNHAIFHLFVLIGSFCHFISVYYYI